MTILLELFGFFRARKKLWLVPLVTLMLMVGAILLAAKGSALAPFIYTLF